MRADIDIGIVRDLQERRETYARFIAPRRYKSPKETRITVDCRTGERTISSVVPIVALPPPRVAPLRNPRMTTLAQIVEATRVMVEEIWNVDRSDLTSRTTKACDGERFAVYRLLRRVNGWSTIRIGKLVDRDHSSIVHGLKRAKDLYEKGEPAWREKFDEAARRLTEMKKSAETDGAGAP